MHIAVQRDGEREPATTGTQCHNRFYANIPQGCTIFLFVVELILYIKLKIPFYKAAFMILYITSHDSYHRNIIYRAIEAFG